MRTAFAPQPIGPLTAGFLFGILLSLLPVRLDAAPNVIDYRYLDEVPQVVKKGTLVYPPTVRGFTFEGYVLLWVTLAEDGSVYRIELLGSNHPRYTESAINAVLETEFTPPLFKEERVGTQFPLSVRFVTEEMLVSFPEVVSFRVLTGNSQLPPDARPLYPAPGLIEFRSMQKFGVISEGVREKSDDFQLDPHGSADSYFDFKDSVLEGPFPYTTAPKVTRFIEPVFPLSKIFSGRGRQFVTTSWLVDPNGFPMDPTSDPDADPLFARAAEAAIRYWRFIPGELEGKRTTTGLAYPFLFDRFQLDRKKKNLAHHLFNGNLDLRAPSELDEPLVLRVLQEVAFPRVKEEATGYAEIKIHVEPDGRVFFPEIVETNNEKIAWAALTAVAQWRFNKPTIDRQSVYVVFKQRFEN